MLCKVLLEWNDTKDEFFCVAQHVVATTRIRPPFGEN